MRRKALLTVVFAIAAVMLTGLHAHAQDATYARTYSVTPKDGMVAQFEAALQAHVRWRIENNDPWTWGMSTVEVGENLGQYGIRSGGHSWADFDAYDAGFGPDGLVHWNATVAPLVESVSSAITTTNQAISNPPPAGRATAFVNVVTFQLRPGRELRFTQAITRATEILLEHNFGGYYVWSSTVAGGGPGPSMRLVSFHTSWADMAEPDPTFEAIMVQALGQDGFMEWASEIGETYRGIESITLRIRPDLGINQN
jgi:hypothetical protein